MELDAPTDKKKERKQGWIRTSLVLLADLSAVCTIAAGEFGCRTELIKGTKSQSVNLSSAIQRGPNSECHALRDEPTFQRSPTPHSPEP